MELPLRRQGGGNRQLHPEPHHRRQRQKTDHPHPQRGRFSPHGLVGVQRLNAAQGAGGQQSGQAGVQQQNIQHKDDEIHFAQTGPQSYQQHENQGDRRADPPPRHGTVGTGMV